MGDILLLPVDYYCLCDFQVVVQTLAVFGGLLTRMTRLLWFQAAPRSCDLFTDVCQIYRF